MSEASGSRVGSMFGPYHLKRALGRGGMGEVYEAEHTVKGWSVAVKLMSETVSRDPVFRERMKREARIAGRLHEPHVVPIHDYGEVDGQLFLEMRLVQGTDLDTLLKGYGPLTPPRAVAIITQIASALDAAHTAEITHRDVKPPNILVTQDDFAYLVDFGIASAKTDEKLTQLGTAVGTWKYMAPERFSNAESDYRADIYSLACVLYECLTGAPPYDFDSAGVLVSSHLRAPVPRPSTARPGVPHAFDAVVARGMAKQPEDRYDSAGDLALAAHEALSSPERSQASNILRTSKQATVPHSAVIPPPARSDPPAPVADPGATSPLRPRHTPPPTPHPPTPSVRPPNWSPAGGPTPAAGRPTPAPEHPQTPPQAEPQTVGWGSAPSVPPPQQFVGGTPGVPPPQPFAGPMPWNQQPPRPVSRNPWPIAAGVALVIVIVIAATGIWIANRGPDRPPQSHAGGTTTSDVTTTSPPTTPSTTTPPAPPPVSKLMSLLPAGYPPGTCKPSNQPVNGSLASVTCGQNTETNGPTAAVYALYPDIKAVQAAFTSVSGEIKLENCPGGGTSPADWWHKRDPNTIVGQIACGIYKGDQQQVMWSNQQNLVFAVIGGPTQGGHGPTLDQLFQWWAGHS